MSRGGWFRLAIFAAVAALAQATKFSAVYLYPLCLLIFAFYKRREILKIMTFRFWIHGILFAVITVTILNACYLWNGSFQSLSDYTFKTALFQNLQSKSGFLAHWPLPLPAPYLEGLDWTKFNESTGWYRGLSYLWGQTQKEPFSNYFLFIFIFKTPIPVLLMLLWGFLKLTRLQDKTKTSQSLVFVWIPLLFYFMYFNFLCKAQLGSRMILMIYPLIHVAIGVLAVSLNRARPAMIILLCWLAVSVLSYHPHYLSYSNEFLWDKKNVYRVFADSNLDWGQNAFYARKFAAENPGVRVNPAAPVSGKILVSVNYLTGIFYGDKFAWYGWVRENLMPVRHVAHSHLLYDVPPDALPEILKYLETKSKNKIP
jgi:hypothetical protein